jgi:hypothetical protein
LKEGASDRSSKRWRIMRDAAILDFRRPDEHDSFAKRR